MRLLLLFHVVKLHRKGSKITYNLLLNLFIIISKINSIMKILAIIGSPKGKGNTFQLVKYFESALQKLRETEFEYLFLKDADLKLCKGCFNCISKGENFCPLKDDREKIEKKILQSDGVIIAFPVYVANIPWLLKNFYDRFGYTVHRPRFFNQGALVIATAAGMGLKEGLACAGSLLNVSGFKFVNKLGLTTPPYKAVSKLSEKEHKIIQKTALKFYNSLSESKIPKVKFGQLMHYNIFKNIIPELIQYLPADNEYWSNKGWFIKNCNYFVKSRINIFQNIFVKIIGKLAGNGTRNDLTKAYL